MFARWMGQIVAAMPIAVGAVTGVRAEDAFGLDDDLSQMGSAYSGLAAARLRAEAAAREVGRAHTWDDPFATAELGLLATERVRLESDWQWRWPARSPSRSAIFFALVASDGVGMALLTPAVSALVSRPGGAQAGAALGLESSAKSLGQIVGPVLGAVLFGASVAVPIWLASGRILGLAPIFAWSGRCTHEPPGGRAAKGKLAFRGQEAR